MIDIFRILPAASPRLNTKRELRHEETLRIMVALLCTVCASLWFSVLSVILRPTTRSFGKLWQNLGTSVLNAHTQTNHDGRELLDGRL